MLPAVGSGCIDSSPRAAPPTSSYLRVAWRSSSTDAFGTGARSTAVRRRGRDPTRAWAEKMLRNAERDRRSTQLAQDAGWRVVRVWECQVRRDTEAVARAVLNPQEPTLDAAIHSLSDPPDGVPLAE